MKNGFVFRLQGRLGNQMWGVSEAFRLHTVAEEIVYILFPESEYTHTSQAWKDYLHSQKWLSLEIIRDELLEDLQVTSVEKDLRKLVDKGYKSFGGFVPSYGLLKQSGLYVEGNFPLDIKPNLIPDKFISMSVRREDYWNNPHLGVLPSKYYRRALEIICEINDSYPIRIFGETSTRIIKSLIPRRLQNRIIWDNSEEDALNDLFLLSLADFSIIANSTFSYLGSFFSKSKKIVMPKPFYLMEVGWDKDLSYDRVESVSYTSNANLRYIYLRALKKIYRAREDLFQVKNYSK